MSDLDITKVANAYMRTLEDTLKNMIVNSSLLQAKLTVATEELAEVRLQLWKTKCTEGCAQPNNCLCKPTE